MPLTPITIDLETHWDKDYTLSKMTPFEYCFDPRFEVQSAATKIGNAETIVTFGFDETKALFDTIDWGNALVLMHNYEFDAIILAGHGPQHFGLKPAMWGCTLAMARPIHAKTVGGSLKALAEHYGLKAKGSLEATNTKGLRLADFTPEMRAAMAEYNKLDTDITWELFKILFRQTPKDEMRLIDLTIRMLVEPRFEVDVNLLQRGLKAERKRKERMLDRLSERLGIEHDAEEIRKTCASSAKFKALLEKLGVEVPMKTSPTTGKEIPALSKTDQAMTELLEHPDETVQAAAEARLGVRSTILETRIERFLQATNACQGRMPIALRYYGADTTGRWSGTMSMNQQNMPRVGKKAKISDVLRRCLRAPKGHKVVVADLSGIELRVNHFLWGEPESMALYQRDRKADLYIAFAAKLFGIEENQVTKDQRQLAKVAQLGLGYGVGWKKFTDVARLMGGITLDDDEAKRVTYAWRETYRHIVAGWKSCDTALRAIHDGERQSIDPWGMCHATKGGIETPRGVIRYPGLHQEDGEWWYGSGRNRARLYGPKCLAKGTKVLTDRGWVRIEDVTMRDRVHDGESFVKHGGKVFKSVQRCVMLDGVWMTPDHEVLTNDGWQEAQAIKGPNGPKVWRPDGAALFGQTGQARVVLGISVRLREHHHEAPERSLKGDAAGRDPKLRVLDWAVDSRKEQHARNVEAPSIRCVEVHDGSLPTTHTPRLEKLWRAWNNSVFALAVVREFLVRHGAYISAWLGHRPIEQRWGLCAGELSVGYQTHQHSKQAEHCQDVRRGNDRKTNRCAEDDAVLLDQERDISGGDREEDCRAPVWDIMNAGPNNCFVVLGAEGPMIVHNCTENLVQHLARHVMTDAMLAYVREDIAAHAPLVHTVHDELILIAPDALAQESLDTLQDKLRTPPTWWPELVTYSEGGFADDYGSVEK